MSSPNPMPKLGEIRTNVAGDIVSGIVNNPQIQSAIFGSLASLISKSLESLVNRLFNKRPPVGGAGEGGGFLDPSVEVPDDKIPVPPVPSKLKDYTSVRIKVFKAQYNRELFPQMYTEDNKDGLYRPALQDVYNRRSKIWFDCTPFKGDHPVQTDEGRADGILWDAVFHVSYNGAETICKADKNRLQDTNNGSGRPIQVIIGDSVGHGFSAWDFAHSFLDQINVGENEGNYEAWVELPLLGMRSDVIKFKVS